MIPGQTSQTVTVQTAPAGTVPAGTVQIPAQHAHGVTIYTVPVQSSHIRENYASKTSTVLGIMQCVVGTLAFILEIIGIIVRVAVFFTGAGFWCGCIFIISGVLGIVSGKTKKTCPIVAFMIMSIISAVFAIMGLLVVYSISAGIDNQYSYYGSYSYYKNKNGQLAVACIMLFLALGECVIAIVSSAICCAATCCHSQPTTGYVNTANGTQQVFIQPPGQQQVIYQMQPSVMYTAPQTQVQYPIQQGWGDPTRVMQQQTVVPPVYSQENQPPPYGNASAPGVAYPQAPQASGYSQPQENHPQKM